MKEKIEAFKKYTNHYINLSDRCISRVNHTMRVMELCGKIAENLKLSEEDIELAKTCGLVHDIARFEQWKRFQTFSDIESIDHGDLGVIILKENNFIRKFNKDENLDGLILKTVKNHNKFKIEKNLSEREKLLYLDAIEEISFNIGDDDFSSEIYDCLLNKKLLDISLKKTKADTLAISLGFVFDLNFSISYKILKDENYYNKIIDIYKNKSNNEEFKKKLENLKNVINKYIDGRCNNVR